MSSQKLTMGHFCWVDFATLNPEETKTFFQHIFAWKYNDQQMPDGSVYTMISTPSGGDVGGLYQMPDEMKAAGVPPHINNYIAVECVDETVKSAQELGATIKAAPFDVFDYGRMAVLSDPTGAVFSLWQIQEGSPDCESKAASRDEPGMFCWQELLTSDVDQASSFYTALFGWELAEMDMGSMDYTIIKNQGDDIGGMMALPAEMQNIPPYWSTYFTVADLDETITVVKKNNGHVIVDPQEIPQAGRFAVCQTPDQIVFCLYQGAG